MDIINQLTEYGIKYTETEDALIFMDTQENLGVAIHYDLGAYRCNFWDANGCCYSPEFIIQDLDELLHQFDRLILSYYRENFDSSLFEDWLLMDLI